MRNENDDDSTVRNIEGAIDAAHLREELLETQNLYLVRWYLLLAHEDLVRLPLIPPPNQIDETELHARIEKGKGALQHALRWTDDLPLQPFTPPTSIDWAIYDTAKSLFILALDYYGVIAPFVFYSRGLAKAEVVDARTVRFSRDPREVIFDALDCLVKRRRAPREEVSGQRSPRAARVVQQIMMSTRPASDQTIQYAADPERLRPLVEDFSRSLAASSRLGDDWVLLGVSAPKLRRFLAALRAVCHVHHNCLAYSSNKYAMTGAAPASAVLVHSSADWVSILSRAGSLPEEVIRFLVNICTYDGREKKRDVSLTPFVILGEGVLGVCPLLIEFGALERNFLALAARRFKNDYDRTSDAFEARMLDVCKCASDTRGFCFSSRSKIQVGFRKTDVDACFYDPRSHCVLFAQCKSVIPPSEPAEIIERSLREKEALAQAQVVRALAAEAPEELWRACFPSLPYAAPEMFYCVLLQSSVGSPQSLDASIPSLDLGYFEQLVSRDVSLQSICQHVSAFHHLPKRGRDFKTVEIPFTFDGYTVVWEGVDIRGRLLFTPA